MRLLSAALTLFGAAPSAAAGQAEPVFVTLGTGGGPIIRVKRAQSANAVIVNGATYLFDVGDGVQQQMAKARIAPASVRAIFVSHHHIDHNADLGPVIIGRWLLYANTALPVIGPPGTSGLVAGLAAAHRPVELAPITIGGPAKPGIATSVAARDLAHDLDQPTLVYEDANIRVLAITVDHFHLPSESEAARFSRSYAYRIETGGKSYVYTGDTGPSKNLVTLARGADVLVTEAVDLKAAERAIRAASGLSAAAIGPIMAHMAEDHLTGSEIGKLAAAARVKQVVITHLAPGLDSEADTTGYTAGITQHYRGPVRVAQDLDRF